MTAQDWVRKANDRLGRCGVTLELRGRNNNLYMRGTFPTKDGGAKRQRSIALKFQALTQKDVKEAESIAREVAMDLNRGEFDWRRFSDVEIPVNPEGTIGHLAQQLEQQKRHRVTPYTWKYAYEALIATLPLDQPISEELLYQWILERDPDNSTMRKKYVTIARSLLDLAGLSDHRVKKLAGEIITEAINPRDLIEDSEIEALWLQVWEEDRSWGWVYGMLATYGLRNHELFHLDLSKFPDVRVLQHTKTGERTVPPLYPEWVEKFKLTGACNLPSRLRFAAEEPNEKLGRKITNRFSKSGLHTPYLLRHCYARRALEVGWDTPIAARMMGHDEAIHHRRYRAFVKDSVYVDAAKRIIAARSSNRSPSN